VDSLRPGDKVRLSLTLPKPEVAVDAFGEVIWAKEKRQGIGFTKVSEENQQLIQSYIDQIEGLNSSSENTA